MSTKENDGSEKQSTESDLCREWREKHHEVRKAYEACLGNPSITRTLEAENPAEYHKYRAQLHHHYGRHLDALEDDGRFGPDDVARMRKPLDHAFNRVKIEKKSE